MPSVPSVSVLFRRRLGFKLFLSYLVVVLVAGIVLASTAELIVPGAFERHLAAMSVMMANMMGGQELEHDLFNNFRAAVTEALTLAGIAALGVAAITSIFVSRQVVTPVREMMRASQRIAEGHYDERVQVPGDVSRNEMDELGQLALRFNQMAARLEQTEAMRRQLVGDITHELRTPLTTIKGSMEGLIDGVLPADPETFEAIYKEADRLQRLVNDLQELSRVEAGSYQLQVHSVAVKEMISAAVKRLAIQYNEKGVALDVEIPDHLPPARADEDRITQVLLNLLGNALQYTPEGGRVVVRAIPAGNEIQVEVSDTGIGIPTEHLPHLFTRFYRVDKSRSRAGGGSGVGLTIAKHLVEAHGGRIWATSPGVGKGSTFTFTLPVSS